MSTYCRITGKSRGLPKPNYFPLLPPISPADAKRLCRITGKSYGLPSHHFIPVLVGFTKHSKSPCHITAKADSAEVEHVVAIGIKHTILKDYRYVFPVLETNADLLQMLESKSSEVNNNKYVYTVDERRCSLVFPSKLEAAVRDGDVRDIMLATHTDTLLLKLRKGGSVEVDVKDFSVDDCADLYEGEGPSQEVLQRRRKRANRNRGDTNDWRRKIFEDKERQDDYEEERISEIKSKRIKVKLDAIKETPHMCSWNNVREGLVELHADPEFDRTVGETFLQFGQQDLQNFINVVGVPIINTLPQCLKVLTENVDLSVSVPGIIKQPIATGEQVIGFPVGAVIAPFQPLVAVTDEFIDNEIRKINMSKDLLKQSLIKQLELQAQYADILPSVQHVPNVAKQLEALISTGNETRTEFGVKLQLENGQTYVPGQFFDSPSGQTFVPGNVIETAMGPCFVAGFSVNTSDGVKFLPGRIVKDNQQPVFVAGQMAVTREGEKFVQGQMVHTKEGPKFIPGQTVITPEGVKFVPGQVIQNADDQSCKFVPGQTIMTPEGPQFVFGQFTQSNEETIFIPGQAVLNENYNWEFIPGKNMKTDNGAFVFIPGKEVVNEQGVSQFVPGRMIIENGSVERFLPGLTVDDGSGDMRFVPGMQLETPEGIKFVEGMLIRNEDSITFAVGKVSSSGADGTTIEFISAKSTDDVVMHDMISNFGMCFSSALAEEGTDETEVFGHMIQSAQGVEFFPGDATGLPAGKLIPGKLMKGKEMRFIPGTMIDNKFIPGQFVTTGSEERFIPGQVIETNEGPKFVPGQVLQTKSGPKFVPGQTMETEDGPKFIPGQIIETKSGPTFIPGQVIYTEEEGSRFVPGQVVDTIEGPRFVPGRVVETGDHVTFIPGQIVETEDGLKFIAPDLEDDLEGGYQFTVQGFEVAQEELKMIQRNSIPYACFNGEMAIDSQTLQHLAQAGMVVGRQLPVDVPVVNIKSFPTTEAACNIAKKLDVDTVCSIKLSYILFTLQQARQSGVTLTREDIRDEDLLHLVNLAMGCDSNADLLETLGNALETVIKRDIADKLNVIDSLHMVSIELAAKIRDKTPDKALLLKNIIKGYIEEKSEVVDKLMIVLRDNKTMMSTAFQHMSQQNPEFVDKVLQNAAIMLENNSDIDEEEAMEILSQAIVKTVAETSQSKIQQALRGDKSESLSLLVESCKVASNLNVDVPHSVKLNHILSILQQARLSSVALTSEEVGDKNLMQLLNMALECDSNANAPHLLGNALEDIIKHDKAGKLDAIDALHTVSVKLAAKVHSKKPNKVLLLQNIIKGNVEEKSEVVDKLVAILKDYETTASVAFQHMSEQNPEFVDKVLENAAIMLKNVSNTNDEKEAMEILYRAFTKTVSETSKSKIQKSLRAEQAVYGNKSNDLQLLVKSCELANNLEVDALQSTQLSHILSVLEQARQSNAIFTSREVGDKNLMKLLNMALECDSNADLLNTLGDALEDIIKQSKATNINAIDALHKASVQLSTKVHNKKPNKVLLLNNIIKGNVEDRSEVIDKLMGVLNDYEPSVAVAFQQMSQQDPEFIDEVLENAAIMLESGIDINDERKAMEILYGAIVKTVAETSEFKIQQLLHGQQSQQKSNKCGNLQLLIKSCKVAGNLNVDNLHSVKLNRILSTLQQVVQSGVALTKEEVGNENLMRLLNTALGCDSNANLLDTLGDALEEVIKQDAANQLDAINALDIASKELAVKVYNKEPNKVLLLKNVLKGNINEKSEIVDKLVTVLKDHETTVSVAFQQMSQQNPDFINKVLENAAVMLESLPDIKDEKEAMEILYQAVVKTVGETSESKIKQALRSQRAQHGDDGVDLKLLVKSCKVASNLDVDASHSAKLNNILFTLQQVAQSGVILTSEEVGDVNLMKLLNMALECDSNANLLDTLGNALEDIIKKDMPNKLNTIDTLQIVSVKLAAKVHDKKPNKVLLLRNMVKGPYKGQKNKLVNNLITVLEDYDITVSTAFQQMSQQNPEFVDKVLENVAVLIENVRDINDEKEAVEMLHRAIVKTVAETSKSKIKKALRGQQTLHADESNDLQLLVKSSQVANNLNVDALQSVKLSKILSSLQQICQSSVSLTSEEVGDEKLMKLFKVALESDIDADLLDNLGNALEEIIRQGSGNEVETIDNLHTLSTKLTAKARNKKPNKVLLLKNMIKDHHKEDKIQVVNKLIAMLNDHETTVCNAFQHMCQQNPDFVDKVLENAAAMYKTIVNKEDEKEAMEMLHKAIIKTVAEASESKVQEALYNKKGDDFHLLVKDAISLAKAMGMSEVVTILNEVLKDRNSVQVLAKDAIVMEVLKRLTVMRQLAESRPNLISALMDLHSDPYAARSDPRLRELVRESAMLMVIPEESLIKSSADIPSSIMFSDNCLAVEDFMVKTRQCGNTFLILKKGIQAVIPREAAKDVLTGRVPYTMLDENGIHYFKPLHVFNALKLPRIATNRFHNYTYTHPALLDDDSSSGTRGSSISMEDLHKTLPNGHGHHSPNHHSPNHHSTNHHEVNLRVHFSLK